MIVSFWSFCEFIKVFALGMWHLKLLILCYEWQQGSYKFDLGKYEGYSRLKFTKDNYMDKKSTLKFFCESDFLEVKSGRMLEIMMEHFWRREGMEAWWKGIQIS